MNQSRADLVGRRKGMGDPLGGEEGEGNVRTALFVLTVVPATAKKPKTTTMHRKQQPRWGKAIQAR
jgi:hypothetical protein